MDHLTEKFLSKISVELNQRIANVRAAAELLDGGATVPFIARYRKERTGSLDEVVITSIRDRLGQLRELEKRRSTILDSLKEMGKLTDELKGKVLAAETMTVLEDIYLPFRPKRRTRATIAKEKGLEPLAQWIFSQPEGDPEPEARKYIDEEKKVPSVEDALSGARDIIAEWINENADARAQIRNFYLDKGVYKSKVLRGKESEGANYKDYFDWSEPVKTIVSHRLLAARRGEREKILSLKIEVPEDEALGILGKLFIKADNACAGHVQTAMGDSFRRLLSLSIETEIRLISKEKADKEAILVFSQNLRQLLMAPPLGQKHLMAIDPGYRTGCKVVCLDPQGKLLRFDAIFPLGSDKQQIEGRELIKNLCHRFNIEFIAIGNGTASRETEEFVLKIGLPDEIQVLIVSESGASIYSASEAAREEFPDQDVTVRGAVSIGRRLMDPLAELVKIDPKSIGVGQYQYDVDQNLLKQSLDDVVVSCVNQVGVELNTASKQILTYVSGLGPSRARAIVDYRLANGLFRSREELFDVTGLGPKAIEQSAGFLRIRDADNPLDSSAVHPESYGIVQLMARDLNCSVNKLMNDEVLRRQINIERYVSASVGLPTLKDIYEELGKPGRDPRDRFEIFRFQEDVLKPEDLTPGMKLQGIVTNITNFGAFVDIGVHLDGLVHISQMSEKFVKNPHDLVKLQQKVQVTVLEVDPKRKRIALSMKANPASPV